MQTSITLLDSADSFAEVKDFLSSKLPIGFSIRKGFHSSVYDLANDCYALASIEPGLRFEVQTTQIEVLDLGSGRVVAALPLAYSFMNKVAGRSDLIPDSTIVVDGVEYANAYNFGRIVNQCMSSALHRDPTLPKMECQWEPFEGGQGYWTLFGIRLDSKIHKVEIRPDDVITIWGREIRNEAEEFRLVVQNHYDNTSTIIPDADPSKGCICGHEQRQAILDDIRQEDLADHHVGGILHILDYMPYNVGKAVVSLIEADGDYPAAKYKRAIAYLLRGLAVVDE